jgi:hypothetical protein
MICPECNGVGRVRKRFLLFFTRQARCEKCLGTGEFPPPVRRNVIGPRARYRGYDDDRWPATSDDRSTTTAIMTGAALSDSDVRRDEPVEIGGGGASGGAGGGASWDDSKEGDAPVIADPFASEAASIESAAVADDAIESDSGSSTSDDSSSDSSESASSSDSDSGTSY